MNRYIPSIIGPSLVGLITFAAAASGAIADDQHYDQRSRRSDQFTARLKPIEEVPALSSAARGRFKASVDETNQIISYELSYEDLEGTPLQAHIHVGQRGANGGISVFLCGNAPAVPPEAVPQPPACPMPPATITGELTPANIIGPVAQGLEPSSSGVNEFEELVRLLRQGVTYVNVHSSRFPGGEIRGQVLGKSHHR